VQVLVVNIVHTSRSASPSDVRFLLNLLEETVRLGVVFDEKLQTAAMASPSPDGSARAGRRASTFSPPTPATPRQLEHRLRGMVCYAASHYLAYFWSVSEASWTLCDDHREAQVTWRHVM
jgi:hypothetical protein